MQHQVNGEADEFLRTLIRGLCLDGECYELAVAIYRGTDYPMVGLLGEGTIRHAGVRLPSGDIFDARGPVSERLFIDTFYPGGTNEVVHITEADLRAVRPVSEFSIASISRAASSLWPDLDWKTPPLRDRVNAFLTELEELSRKHGFWIRGPVPAQAPQLTEDDSGAGGYRWHKTAEGLGVVLETHYDKHERLTHMSDKPEPPANPTRI